MYVLYPQQGKESTKILKAMLSQPCEYILKGHGGDGGGDPISSVVGVNLYVLYAQSGVVG